MYVAHIFIVLICTFLYFSYHFFRLRFFQMQSTVSIRLVVLNWTTRITIVATTSQNQERKIIKLYFVMKKIASHSVDPLCEEVSSVHCQLYLPARLVCFPCLSLYRSPHLLWTRVPSSHALSEPLMSCSPYVFKPPCPCWPAQHSHCNIQQKSLCFT